MTILQVGKAKSGNSWIYKILREILELKGEFKEPYIKSQPIYSKIKDMELSLDFQHEVDVMDITDDGLYYRASSLFREEIQDLEKYVKNTSLIWSHSPYCKKTNKVLNKTNNFVYIVRDPRDVLISWAHFTQTEYMRRFYPNVKKYSSVEDAIEKNYKNSFRAWAHHVFPYLLNTDPHIVFYERLKNFKDEEILKLSEYIDLALNDNEKEIVKERTSYKKMKKKNPKHVRKGKNKQWEENLSNKQLKYAEKNLGDLLEILNYPITKNEDKFPEKPKELNKKKIKNDLKELEKSFPKKVYDYLTHQKPKQSLPNKIIKGFRKQIK